MAMSAPPAEATRVDALAVGVDVGGTHAKLVLVTADGQVLEQDRIDSGAAVTIDLLGPRIVSAMDGMVRRAAPERGRVGALGLVAPGFVDEGRTATLFSPNTPGLLGDGLPTLLADATGLPVTFDSDVNGAAFGEATWGAGRGAARCFTLTLGTGVGGGFVVGGKVVRVAGGAVGDIGHIILEPGGRRCGSGCSGCAEGLVGAQGLVALAARYGAPRSIDRPARIIEAARDGTRWACDTAAESGRLVGILLASIMATLLPDRVVIVGGTSLMGEPFLDAVRSTVRSVGGAAYVDHRPIVPGAHPTTAGAMGAAALAYEEVWTAGVT
jgi:glucokinase